MAAPTPTPQGNRAGAPAPTPAPHSPANAAEDAKAPVVPGGAEKGFVAQAVDTVKSAVGLGEPEHAKVMTGDPAHAGTVASVHEAVKSMPGIHVRAKTPGFIYNERKVEGDEFVIGSMKELGDWMEPIDAGVKEKHEAMMAERDGKTAQKEDLLDQA